MEVFISIGLITLRLSVRKLPRGLHAKGFDLVNGGLIKKVSEWKICTLIVQGTLRTSRT